jgi:hypothetical protein
LFVDRESRRLGSHAPFPGGTGLLRQDAPEALAWRLVWLMAPELGVGPFLL